MEKAATDVYLKIKCIQSYYEKIIIEPKEKYEFPFDERYILLLNKELTEEEIKSILSSYTDQELDLMVDTLENYIYNLTYEAAIREENEIFNFENDKVVLKKCLVEYKNRF